MWMNIILLILFIMVVIFILSIRIVQQYQQAVVLRMPLILTSNKDR
ncbi:hypothetical protein [Bacillus sp. 1NLA3E]|nr:hypothetical protein [Bacillus sp. 1NLA3E]